MFNFYELLFLLCSVCASFIWFQQQKTTVECVCVSAHNVRFMARRGTQNMAETNEF